MADENRGNPVTGGYNGSGEDIARLIASTLDSNLKSYTAQLRGIFSELHKVVDSSKKSISESSRTSRSFERRKMTDIEDMYEDVTSIADVFQKMQKEIQKEHKELFASSEDFKRDLSNLELKDLESLLQKKQLEIAKKYAEAQEENLKQFEQKLREIETRDLDVEQKETLKQLERKKKIAEKVYSRFLERPDDYAQEQIDRVKDILDNVNKKIQNVYISADSAKKKDSEKAAREYEVKQRKLEEKEREEKENAVPVVAEFNKDALKEAMNAVNSAKQQSPYLNELLGDENDGHKKTDFEKFEENKREQLKLLDKASKTLDAYRDKLLQDKANGKITQEQLDEELGVIDKQKANIDRAKQAMEGWTPIKDAMQEAAKSLKDSVKNVLNNLAKFAFERLEDKYLKAYQEGFEKVYQSVENTRNQISARSKLDQGGFSEMQDQIQSTIEEQGLENVVSQSDVNEALISLSSAGITNTDMLKTLALEQAKLQASGSSINISNEETLQRVQEYIGNQMAEGRSYEDVLSDLPKMFEQLSAYETQTRDYYGHDLALQGGQYNKIINEIWDMANTAGKTWEQTAKDIGASATYAQAEFSAGLDPDTFMAAIREIRDGNITNASNLAKILYTNAGLTQEGMRNMSTEEIMDKVYSTINDALEGKNPEYLKQVMDAYGISGMTPDQAVKMLKKELDVGVASDEEIANYKLQQEQALKEGTYYSATQNWQKQAENKMAEIAIDAEKQYKGNVFVEEGFKEVTGILGSIEDAVLNIGKTAMKNGLGNTVGSFFGSKAGNRGALNSGTTGSITDIADDVVGSGATGQNGLANILSKQNVTDFMTGGLGSSTAGNIGAGLGMVAGAGMMGYSVISNVKEAESVGEAMGDIFTDPSFYGGLGTTLGSAIAGPVGGAIGGAIGTLSSKLGNWLADEFVGDVDTSIQDASKELIEAANKQIDAANEQIASAQKQINEFSNWGKERKKSYLIEKGILEKEDANNKTEEDINKLFNDNVITEQNNIMKEQENIIQQQELIKRQSLDASAFDKKAFDTIDAGTHEQLLTKSGEELMEMVRNNTDLIGGEDNWKDVYSEWSKEKKTLDVALKQGGISKEDYEKKMKDFWMEKADVRYTQGVANLASTFVGDMGGSENAVTIFKSLQDVENMEDKQLREYLQSKGSYTDSELESMNRENLINATITEKQKEFGFDEEAARDAVLLRMKQWDQDKKYYEEADKKFQDKFKTFKEKYTQENPNAQLDDIIAAYAIEYINDDRQSAFINGVFTDENGVVHIDSDKGLYKTGKDGESAYKEGMHFKTGLTDVPYDNYPAFLHAGERVLTKEEAEAYNMISSTAIKNAYGNADTISSYILSNLEDNIYNNTSASNVFATRQYGTDSVKKSIDNQTNSLSELLEQILEAIKGLGISLSLKSNNSMSAAKYNVIKGNSNVTQLNTL